MPQFCSQCGHACVQGEDGRPMCPTCSQKKPSKKRSAEPLITAGNKRVLEWLQGEKDHRLNSEPRRLLFLKHDTKPPKISKELRRREQSIQQNTEGILTHWNFLVFVTTLHLKNINHRCQCGRQKWITPDWKTGQTPGIPDIFTVRPHWNSPFQIGALWRGIEMKGSKTSVSPEQQIYRNNGLYPVARSEDAAVEFSAQVDRTFEHYRLLRYFFSLQAEMQQIEKIKPELRSPVAIERLNLLRTTRNDVAKAILQLEKMAVEDISHPALVAAALEEFATETEKETP